MRDRTREWIRLEQADARARLLARGHGADPRVRRMLAHLAEHVFDPAFRPGRLVQACGLGDHNLRRLFRRQLGVSPSALARAVRLETARTLLAEPRAAVDVRTAAAAVGLSYSTFWRLCRHRWDRPPSALRAAETLPEAA